MRVVIVAEPRGTLRMAGLFSGPACRPPWQILESSSGAGRSGSPAKRPGHIRAWSPTSSGRTEPLRAPPPVLLARLSLVTVLALRLRPR